MTHLTAFASKFRIQTLLCCSAAVLLAACGGNVDPGSEQLSATAAGVSTDAGAATASGAEAAPAVEAIAEAAPAMSAEAAPAVSTEAAPAIAHDAAPAAGTQAASTAGAAGQAANATTQAFALTGYDSTPQQAPAVQEDAPIEQ